MPYLDHAATTPMLPHAVAAMTEQLARVGNASSLHAAGRRSRRVVEESRETIAAAVGARPFEVVFTGGGTESDNLAVKGLFWARRDVEPARRRILVSSVEHHAVLDAVTWLGEHEGAVVTWLPVDPVGRVDLAAAEEIIDRNAADTALLTVMWANNEVGTVQPVARLAAVAAAHGIPVHTDAVQALGQLPVDAAAAGVDALTVTGHKIGGPLGVGALVLRGDTTVVPLQHGGGQERELRSGTLDHPAIVGFAAAVAAVSTDLDRRAATLRRLRDRLVAGVLDAVPDAILNGDPSGDPASRLPGNAHFSFPGCEGDALLMLLDARGIACSTGSACSAGIAQPSHVLLAMGADEARARASLRFSLGHTSTEQDVDALVEAIGPVVARASGALLRR